MTKHKIIISSFVGAASLALAFSASAQVSVAGSDRLRTETPGGAASSTLRVRMEARFGSTTPPHLGMRVGSSTPGMRDTSSTTRMENQQQNQQQRQEERMTALQGHSDTEIANRIDSLNKLLTRIDGMTKISASDRSGLTISIQTEIASLTSLKTSIDTDTSTTSLKTDAQSITKSYRVYALVLPQASITAAADRVLDLVTSFNTLSTKLEGYVTTAQTNGTNVSAAVSAMSLMNAKVSDASTQSKAALTEVAGLQPDLGAASTLQANTAALKDAQSKIKTATSDLAAARKDVTTIVATIKGSMKAPGGATSAGASASVSASTTVH